MLDLPKEQRIHNLLNEAVGLASTMNRSFTADLVSALHRARTVLSAPVTAQGQLSLILSAARRHILDLEKRTVGLIIGDEPISHHEMTSLVGIRLICTQLLKIFTDVLSGLKLMHHREKKHAAGLAGS